MADENGVLWWLATGGGTATAVGLLRGASGSLPPWMIDNLAEALYGLGQALVAVELVSVFGSGDAAARGFGGLGPSAEEAEREVEQRQRQRQLGRQLQRLAPPPS